MTRRQYRLPPIEEAVCEFRFAPGQAWNFTVRGLFYEKARDLYTASSVQRIKAISEQSDNYAVLELSSWSYSPSHKTHGRIAELASDNETYKYAIES